MAISVRAVSNAAGQSSGSVAASTVSITPTLPTGTTTGDRVFVYQTHSCSGGSATAPTGWTVAGQQDQTLGSGSPASGTGARYGTWYYRDKDATWSTMPAFTLVSQANNSHWVGAVTITPTSGSLFAAPIITSPNGSFNTATTSYVNTTPAYSKPNTYSGSLFLVGTGLNDNVTSTTSGLTQTSTTFGTVTERCDGGTATGFSAAGKIHTAPVTTGSTNRNSLSINLTLSAASQGESLFLQQTEFVSTGAMSTLADDFDTGSTPDAAKWVDPYSAGVGTLSGGRLVQSSNNMVSLHRYSLVGSSAFIQAFTCSGSFQIWSGPDGGSPVSWWDFSTAGFANVYVENTGSYASVPHTSGNCYRILESGGNLLFDYSTDGAVTWTNLVTSAWVYKPQVVVAAFVNGSNTWDNFNTVPPPPSNTNLFFDMF